jgi:light-independent protochlorophyllide reductase subunit B
MGFEGANVLFDTWVHPLMMGLEEHLLRMFREDFEFHESAGASHLGHAAAAASRPAAAQPGGAVDREAPAQPVPALAEAAAGNAQAAAVDAAPAAVATATDTTRAMPTDAATAPAAAAGWAPEAERELHKIPFFVRGKARRNTERYARDRGLATITLETLYDAKAHFSR